tara:strand:+ start:1854 stop:2303 length:450 start_codon:yes stop_codon:yes gene_type:complete
MPDISLAFSVSALAFSCGIIWISNQAINMQTSHPNRLITQLRLSQYAALLMVLTNGVYIGLALAHEQQPRFELEIALSTGFILLATITTTWAPEKALTVLSIGWIMHAILDLAHIAEVLSVIQPSWYSTACAMHNVVLAGFCYLPVWRR